jgi:exoribonuclease-2
VSAAPTSTSAPEPGSVDTAVLLADKGELTAARVAVREGSRYVIETVAGERFAVAAGRLFWIGRAQVRDHAALVAHWGELATLVAGIDLEGAWQALEARGIAGDAAQIAALAFTKARKDAVSKGSSGSPAFTNQGQLEDAVALAVFRDPTWFRIKERVLLRESAESVAETQKKRVEKAAEKRRLELASRAFAARLAGAHAEASHTEASASERSDTASDNETQAATALYREALLDVALFGRESTRWGFAQPLAEALGVHPDKALDLLVRLGELAPDVNLAPLRAGLPMSFGADVMADAEKAARHRPSPAPDLTTLDAVAIDDPDTTEVDDAFAMVGKRVYVLIADTAAYFEPGSLLDRTAALRASTVYLPEGKVPMLPPILGEGPMSLLTGEPRTAMVFSFELEPDGRASGFELVRARVRIARRMTYEEADQVLTTPGDDPHGALLAKVQAAMDKHRAWRHGRGAVTFQRPEVYFTVDAAGRVSPKIGDPLGPARQLIQELAVATCSLTAVFCAERQIPCIYRAQAAPDDPPPVADPRTGRIDDAMLQYELLRRLKPSTLQLEVAPHWTLGVPAYAQVTSPIRRYADLLMHQQLIAFLRTGKPALTASKLQGQLFELQRRATLVRRVEQESRRYWALRYLEQNPGQTLEGTVLREIGKKSLVELQPLALHELMPLRRRRAPGTRIRFEVIAADARNDALELKEAKSDP